MASVLDLPQELIDAIVLYLPKKDCKSVRLASKHFTAAAIPGLVRVVNLSLQPSSWQNFVCLAADARFANNVRKLVIFPNLLPKFDNYSGWLWHMDTKAIEKQAREKGSKAAISTLLYRSYNEYRSTVASQQNMNDEWLPRLRGLLPSLTRLNSLASAMWWDCWPSSSSKRLEQPSNRPSQIDQFFEWLRPRDIDFTQDMVTCEESWFSNEEGLLPYVYRSSVTQARLFCATLLLQLQDRLSNAIEGIIDLKLCLSVLSHDADYGDFVTENGSDDETRYHEMTRGFERSLNQADASKLQTLSVHLQEGYDFTVQQNVYRGLRVYLPTATALTTFSFRSDPVLAARELDGLRFLSDIHLPCLQHIKIESSKDLRSSLETLQKVITIHARSLEHLALHRISLDEDIISPRRIEPGTSRWETFFKELPQMISLGSLQLEELYEMDNTTDWYRPKLFSTRDAARYQPLYDYILHGGKWPGWSNAMFH